MRGMTPIQALHAAVTDLVREVVRDELARIARPRRAPLEGARALEAALEGILGASGETTAAKLARGLEGHPALRTALEAMGYPDATPHQVGLALARAARAPGSRLRRRHSNGTRWRVVLA